MTNVPKPPRGPVWAATVAIFGAFGTVFDIKHAYLSLTAKLDTCVGFFGCTDHIMRLEDDVFGGVLLFLAILIVSLLALYFGVRGMIHHMRHGEDEPPVAPKPTKRPTLPRAPRKPRAATKRPTTDASPANADETREEV